MFLMKDLDRWTVLGDFYRHESYKKKKMDDSTLSSYPYTFPTYGHSEWLTKTLLLF